MLIVLRPAFVAASVTWAVLLAFVPFAASRLHATPTGTALILAVYAIGSVICHQLPERSYQLWTAQMPVCARCAGIYAGAAVAAVASTVLWSLESRGRGPAVRPDPGTPSTTRGELTAVPGPGVARAVLLIAVLPTLATLVYEWTTGHMPAHWVRAATGVPLGATVAWLVLSSMPRRARAENQVN